MPIVQRKLAPPCSCRIQRGGKHHTPPNSTTKPLLLIAMHRALTTQLTLITYDSTGRQRTSHPLHVSTPLPLTQLSGTAVLRTHTHQASMRIALRDRQRGLLSGSAESPLSPCHYLGYGATLCMCINTQSNTLVQPAQTHSKARHTTPVDPHL